MSLVRQLPLTPGRLWSTLRRRLLCSLATAELAASDGIELTIPCDLPGTTSGRRHVLTLALREAPRAHLTACASCPHSSVLPVSRTITALYQ